MKDRDLEAFGRRLRQLRKARGFSQNRLVDELSFIHAKRHSNGDLRLDASRISKWERPACSKLRPGRTHLLYLLECFIEQLSPEDAIYWAAQAGYTLTPQDISPVFLNPDTHRPAEFPLSGLREDRGEAPDVHSFFGRTAELATLQRWAIVDRCRLIAVLGMGGIGKTTMVAKLMGQIKSEFNCVFWRSLLNAPPFAEILGAGIEFLSNRQSLDLPNSVNDQISLFSKHLQQYRCLIIFDNVETIFESQRRAGHYQAGYEPYGQLFRRIGQTAHQSCIVLTGREMPMELVPLIGASSPVRALTLPGITSQASRELLADRDLRGDDTDWETLGQRYGGNPLALRQISASIRDLFDGDIAPFLKEIKTTFGEIRQLLAQQFDRLPPPEQEIMYWLAICREPVGLRELHKNLIAPPSSEKLFETLESLRYRSLIEQRNGCFMPQNVITEYITRRLIEQVCDAIKTENIDFLQRFALIQAQAKTYIRESQTRLILAPVSHNLLRTFSRNNLEERLAHILSTLRQTSPPSPGYAAGNMLNLLLHLKADASRYDFWLF